MKLILALFGLIATVTAWESVVSNFLTRVISKDSTLNFDNPALAFCGLPKDQCDTAPYCKWDNKLQFCTRVFSPVLEQNASSNFTSFNSTNYNNATSNSTNSTAGYNQTFTLEYAAVNCTNQTYYNCNRTYGCVWNNTRNLCQQNNTRQFTLEWSNSTSNSTNSTTGYNYTFFLEAAAVNCTNQTFSNCSRISGCAWNYTLNSCQLNNTRKFFLESEFAAVNCTNQTYYNCSRTYGCLWNNTRNVCQQNNTRQFVLEWSNSTSNSTNSTSGYNQTFFLEAAAVNCTNQTFSNCSKVRGCAWNYTLNRCQLNNTRQFFLESEFAAVNCTNQTYYNCSRTYGCVWNNTRNVCQQNNTRQFVLEWSNSTSNSTNSTSGYNYTLFLEAAAVNCTNQTFSNCSKVRGCAWNYTRNVCQLNNTRQFVLEWSNSTSNSTNSTSGYNYTLFLEASAVNCTNQTYYNCSRTYGCAWNNTRNICQQNNTRQFVLEWSNSTSNSTNSTSGYNYTLFLEASAVNCTNQTFSNCSRIPGCAWNYTLNRCQLNNTRKFFLESEFAPVNNNNCSRLNFANCSRTYGCGWNYTYNVCQKNNTRYFLEQNNSTNSTGSFNSTQFSFDSFYNFTMNSTNQTSQSFNSSSSFLNQTERTFRLCNELNKTQCTVSYNCKWSRNNSCIYNNSTQQVPFIHKLLDLERY